MVCDFLLEESNVQPVSTPVTVCGDIHGQVSIFDKFLDNKPNKHVNGYIARAWLHIRSLDTKIYVTFSVL